MEIYILICCGLMLMQLGQMKDTVQALARDMRATSEDLKALRDKLDKGER